MPPLDPGRIHPPGMPDWIAGRRVVRPDGSDGGVILEVTSQIKVRWDGGRTSYFKFHELGNVMLELCEASK